MVKSNSEVHIDLVCKKTDVQDILNKDGQKLSVTAQYTGTLEVEGGVVAVGVKLLAEDVDVLELVAPFKAGATRQMSLSLTNEDLANHVET